MHVFHDIFFILHMYLGGGGGGREVLIHVSNVIIYYLFLNYLYLGGGGGGREVAQGAHPYVPRLRIDFVQAVETFFLVFL